MSLIIALSGKKQSGKNTAANYLSGKYLLRTNEIKNFKINTMGLLEFKTNNHWSIVKEGDFNFLFGNTGIKLYSFADYLKEFCIDVFGLTNEQCYGTDEQKNTLTSLKWENMPTPSFDLSEEFNLGSDIACVKRMGKNGQMTAREVLQYLGTDIIRKMLNNAWVNATLNKIRKEKPDLAIITDARFPNEIEGVNSIGGKTVRLLRHANLIDEHYSEKALDNYSHEKFTLVIDNRNDTIEEQCIKFDPYINQWFDLMKYRENK